MPLKHPPHIEITDHETAVRCCHCGKSSTYQRPSTLAAWSRALRAFIKAHRMCTMKPRAKPNAT